MKRLLSLLLGACLLSAQDTPRPNRVAWQEIFPEPLPDGDSRITLEGTSQFLRPDRRTSLDKRSLALLDGEEWQLTADWGVPLGPGRFNLRVRLVDRSGGFMDQGINSYHKVFSFPQGGRELVPEYVLEYHLERDGVVVADLHQRGVQLMDADIAYVVTKGDALEGFRVGAALQLPTGKREDFSGSGSTDALVGAAAWTTLYPVRFFGQVEQVWLKLPSDSPYRQVLERQNFSRVWLGAAVQGGGTGPLTGLGLELCLAYLQSPYRTGISRIDVAGWQQHWIFTHRSLPRWRFGISEEAGTFNAPDITMYLSFRLRS